MHYKLLLYSLTNIFIIIINNFYSKSILFQNIDINFLVFICLKKRFYIINYSTFQKIFICYSLHHALLPVQRCVVKKHTLTFKIEIKMNDY